MTVRAVKLTSINLKSIELSCIKSVMARSTIVYCFILLLHVFLVSSVSLAQPPRAPHHSSLCDAHDSRQSCNSGTADHSTCADQRPPAVGGRFASESYRYGGPASAAPTPSAIPPDPNAASGNDPLYTLRSSGRSLGDRIYDNQPSVAANIDRRESSAPNEFSGWTFFPELDNDIPTPLRGKCIVNCQLNRAPSGNLLPPAAYRPMGRVPTAHSPIRAFAAQCWDAASHELSALLHRGLVTLTHHLVPAVYGSARRVSALLRDPTVAASLILAAVLMVAFRHKRPKYDLDSIPGPWRHALPLVGNLFEVLRPDFHRVLLEWADKYGGIVRVKFLWHDGLVVTDPAALAAICGRGEGAMDKAAAMYSPINTMCTPRGHANLLTSIADDSWRAVRKAVALSFAFGNIRRKFPIIRDRTGELVEWLRCVGPDEAVDVDQAALRVTLDVIGLTAFGHDYGATRLAAVPPDHLLRVLPRAFTEVMRRIANPLRALAPAWFKNGNKGVQSFRDFQFHMDQLLQEVKARPPARGDTDIGAQLHRVLQEARELRNAKAPGATPRRGPRITDERILSEIGILFVEGFETTGHTISWTLFNIATTPGVQEAVAAELASLGLLVRPDGGRGSARALELEDLKRLRYLTACVKEAMRMFPVVSIMGRVAERPTRVGPYLVPAGTQVATPLFAIQNTIHNWVDPLQYKPDRWMDVPLEAYVLDMRAKENLLEKTISTPTPTAAATAPPPGRSHSDQDLNRPPRLAESLAVGSISARTREEAPSQESAPTRPQAHAGGSPAEDMEDEDDGWGGRRTGISFMPFSEGPRSCVGQSLAKLEVMTVLAMVLSNFRIELAPEMGGREGVRKRESTHLTLQTSGLQGIRMHLNPREMETV